jgi:predicted nucleic acid-binding protein
MTTEHCRLPVMLMLNTSVRIGVFRDRTSKARAELSDLIGTQDYLELSADGWGDAARIYSDLRRKGLTVHSTIDGCIAQTAIYHQAVLVHNDRDFETITQVRSLRYLCGLLIECRLSIHTQN